MTLILSVDMSIGTRFKESRETKGLTQQSIATDLRVSRGAVSQIELDKSNLMADHLAILVDKYGFDANYILTGKGMVSAAMPTAAVKERILPVVVDKQNNPVIKILPTRAQAGFLQERSDAQYWARLPEIALPDRKYTQSTYIGIEIDGESMEFTLSTGDIAICEYISNPKYIDYGRIYIVVLAESMPVVKRCLAGETPETLALVSDNINYPPYEVQRADIIELWRFDCLLRKQTKTIRNTEKVF